MRLRAERVDVKAKLSERRPGPGTRALGHVVCSLIVQICD